MGGGEGGGGGGLRAAESLEACENARVRVDVGRQTCMGVCAHVGRGSRRELCLLIRLRHSFVSKTTPCCINPSVHMLT